MLHAIHHQETLQFDAMRPARGGPAWTEYQKGVSHALIEKGLRLRGFDGVAGCDLPLGAGPSSSALYELAVAHAFQVASGWAWDPVRMARAGRRAENLWVGVNCGTMDQLISAIGQSRHALFIDCRDLSNRTIPLPEGYGIVIMDTMTRRGLIDTLYNERRANCARAAAYFGAKTLRDVTLEIFISHNSKLDLVACKRARRVITENARTLEAAAAMQAGDARRLGALMNASHESLRDEFEVTTPRIECHRIDRASASGMRRGADDRRGLWRMRGGAGALECSSVLTGACNVRISIGNGQRANARGDRGRGLRECGVSSFSLEQTDLSAENGSRHAGHSDYRPANDSIANTATEMCYNTGFL